MTLLKVGNFIKFSQNRAIYYGFITELDEKADRVEINHSTIIHLWEVQEVYPVGTVDGKKMVLLPLQY